MLWTRQARAIVLQPQDFDANHDRALRASEKCRSLFSDLIGCEDIIARFEGYQQTVAGMRLHGVDPRPYIPFTFLFKGPPGTGKTTTARKVGQIFYDMGFLSYPEIIECSVSDLIARYTGQTGPKVVKLLERALGKVLFIYEAYRLTDGEYAKEAVGELVDCLTKKRFEHKIVIVLAGYKEDIDKLMLTNRGLRSRFATEVIFRHMRPEQSLKLLQQTVGKEGITVDGVDQQRTDARHHIVGLFEKLTRVVLWANGRDVKALGARIIVQMFQARGRDPNATRELIFTADNLTRMLESRLDDLEILQSGMAVSAAPGDHPDRGAMLSNHGIRLFHRYERTGNMDDLEAAISDTQRAVYATSEDHPNRAKWLGILGSQLCARHERIGNMDDLEAAISNTQHAISATPKDHPDRAGRLNNLGIQLSTRYERTGEMDDLKIAISSTQHAISITPKDHNRAIYLSNLGGQLLRRYERMGSMDDLEAAISNSQKAVSTTPGDHPDRAERLSNLGSNLLRQYGRTGNMDDFEAAISNTQQAISATPKDHPNRAGRLNNLGIQLSTRYERTGDMDDLEAAISNTQQAVSAIPEDHPDRLIMLSSLGSQLSSRYERMGNIDDLEASILNTQQAISTTLEDQPNRMVYLSNLGMQLSSRYERIGNMDDLDAAVSKIQQAVSTTPEDHPDRAAFLSNLGMLLLDRYERTGNMDDLDAAISNIQQAVSDTPEDHPERAGYMSNLGNQLLRRYQQTGNMDDLEAATSNTQQAISATPEDHLDRAKRLSNLGCLLLSRYNRTGNMDDLAAAISNTQQAIYATPRDHPDRAERLSHLGSDLLLQYGRIGNMDDLEAAILNTQYAVSTTPETHPKRITMLNNSGMCLWRRYERTGNMDDLEAAISNAQQAISATPEEHTNRARLLLNLGTLYFTRGRSTMDDHDLAKSLSAFQEAAKSSNAAPLTRVEAARHALRILQVDQKWEQASQLAQESVRLLPDVCSRYLSRQDQQHAVSQTAGLAADACSFSLKIARINHVDHANQALQQIEYGRGLILGYLIDSRSDISILRQDHPDLAEELERLRFKVNQSSSTAEALPLRERLRQERDEAIRQMDNCLHEIRTKDGFDRFLLQPALDELIQGAAEGPIVIVNVTDISSDAIIVSRSGVRAIELPEMASSETSLLVRDLRSYRNVDETRWKYSRNIDNDTDAAAQFQRLYANPRVWWIGTGVASSLPFHAACKCPDSQEDALTRTISSYTPTIKSLVHARSCAEKINDKRDEGDKKLSVLVVTMTETPGQKPLPGVAEERSAIEEALGDVFIVKALEQPSSKQVLGAMIHSDIVHFACHGSPDHVDPSSSHLLLQSMALSGPSVDRLTVQEISDNQTSGRAQIAYLSACSTAEVKAAQFADEALHIVSAFQVAGFGHVIGSLWSADDDTCVRMARYFYEYLARHGRGEMTDRMVAEALRDATLRVRPGRDARLWAPYIHSGA